MAINGESSAKNLLHGTFEVLRHRLEAHGASNLNDLVQRDGFSVFDVLLLFAVAWRLLEGLDNERRGRGDDRDGGLTILDGQLDCDAQALPVTGGFGDIFTDLCVNSSQPSILNVGSSMRPRVAF